MVGVVNADVYTNATVARLRQNRVIVVGTRNGFKRGKIASLAAENAGVAHADQHVRTIVCDCDVRNSAADVVARAHGHDTVFDETKTGIATEPYAILVIRVCDHGVNRCEVS